MRRIQENDIKLGQTLQLNGAIDREAYIRQTLERLRQEKLKQVEGEVADIIEQAKQEAANIIAQGQAAAEQLIAEGQAQQDDITGVARNQGHEEGYKAGYAEGREAAEQDSKTLMVSANILLERAYEAQEKILDGFAPKAVTIMHTLCEKILHKACEDFTADDWKHWFKEVLGDLHTQSKFRIVVGASSYREFQTFSAELSEALGSMDRVRFEVDPHLAPFEMYAITDEGSIDISPTSQLSAYLSDVEEKLGLPTTVPEEINPIEETNDLNDLQAQMFQTITGQKPNINQPPVQQTPGETTDLQPIEESQLPEINDFENLDLESEELD